MVYLNVRHTVTDYETWRPFFDKDEARRKADGATGVNQVYRDLDDANIVTLVMEWDNAENARKFMDDPALRDLLQQAGVIGMPAVRTILSRT
jgi:hypothetical protein